MVDFCGLLKAADRFSFQIDASFDEVLKSGTRVQYHKSGEVRVETTVNPGVEPEVFAVRTAGVAMGAAGFMDGRPRWGTHQAVTPVRCLKITRTGLASLVGSDPQVGARLLLVIGRMMAGVQREQIDRIKVSARIGRSLQEQIDIDRQAAHG